MHEGLNQRHMGNKTYRPLVYLCHNKKIATMKGEGSMDES